MVKQMPYLLFFLQNLTNLVIILDQEIIFFLPKDRPLALAGFKEVYFYAGKFRSGRNRKCPFNSIKKDVFWKCICES